MADFDEVNVIQEIDRLYDDIYTEAIEAFRRLFKARYAEMWAYLERGKADEDFLDDLFDLYMMDFLATPNPVVGYAFDTEFLRKRDKAKEAIQSAPTKLQKQTQYDKNVRFISIQDSFFIDLVSDEAARLAMKNAGIEKVMWITQRDAKVCFDCDDRHGVVYPIDDVPDKPHPRCRCYLRPVTK